MFTRVELEGTGQEIIKQELRTYAGRAPVDSLDPLRDVLSDPTIIEKARAVFDCAHRIATQEILSSGEVEVIANYLLLEQQITPPKTLEQLSTTLMASGRLMQTAIAGRLRATDLDNIERRRLETTARNLRHAIQTRPFSPSRR